MRRAIFDSPARPAGCNAGLPLLPVSARSADVTLVATASWRRREVARFQPFDESHHFRFCFRNPGWAYLHGTLPRIFFEIENVGFDDPKPFPASGAGVGPQLPVIRLEEPPPTGRS